MAKIISIHSFRGGTGKSNTTANLATMLAAEGRRVGVVDTDIQSPGIHVLFGMDETEISNSLNTYLWGKCPIEQTAYDVTARLGATVQGRVFLIPSSIKAGEISRVVRDGYDVNMLNDGFYALIKALRLDVLLIDTHPGLSEDTLLSVAVSDALGILLRPDQQDYQGTGVTVQVARKLDVPRMVLIVNKAPPEMEPASLSAQIAQTYGCEVAGVLHHSDEMMRLASSGIFALRYPDHPITATLRRIAARLVA
ncbi:MAG TPA: MinD/ParA family protein [Roseiflexaceae bacterium]|nr:MinD/ParA family protein [Roseiflexaceae bacterium]